MSRVLGAYKLIRRIAAGGMGEVWLAVLERSGGFSKTLALKTILPSLAERPGFRQRFEAEASTAALLNHPNIVQVFDHGRIDSVSYLAMEYVEGPDLAGLFAGAEPIPFPAAATSELGTQICRGLGHAHERRDPAGRPMGIVHGDVSPSNVLISCDGVAKLTDFGLARLRTDEPGDDALAGKICYMSPEQAAGRPLDPRSDLYSLGLVLYELLCGRRAYEPGAAPADTLAAVRAGRFESPARASGGRLSSAWCELLERALASEPDRRFASATELARALAAACPPCGPEALGALVRDALADLPAPGSRPPEPTEVAGRPISPPPAARRRWLWWSLGLVLVCWGAGFGWWWLHPAPPARPAPPADLRPRAPAGLTARMASAETRPASAAELDPPPVQRAAAPPRAQVDYTRPHRPPPPKPPPEALAARPEPARLELLLAPELSADVDHRPVAGRRVRILDEQAHLVRLAPSAGGPPEVLLRLLPPDRQHRGWRLNVRATPWMRLRLAGRPAGQTPRSGLSLPAGESTLELVRDGQVLRLGLRTDAGGPGP